MSNIIYDANFNGPEAVPFIGEAEKYHYVYLIVNTLNQKLYIGVHSTEKLNDGYMSSSGYVHEDIDKFGIENFKKYNLFYFNTRKEALDKEKELVSKEFCQREDVYNITMGGGGIKLAKCPDETKKKMSKTKKGKTFSEKHRKNLSDSHKGICSGINHPMYGKKHKPESIDKMRKSAQGKHDGKKNPQAKAVLKFDLNNNLICEFPTVKDAVQDSNINGKRFYRKIKSGESINGFYYRYKEENNN